jgi:serine/threonine protein kinase
MNESYCLSSSIRKVFQLYKENRFLINMIYAFQDRENLYLVCDLMSGGDLRFHIGKKKRFTEEQTSKGQLFSLFSFHIEFMISCMIVGLEYMHNNGVIHRDIKPENVVMDENGYVRITDLGIARIWTPENSQDTSGTPGYMGNNLFYNLVYNST